MIIEISKKQYVIEKINVDLPHYVYEDISDVFDKKEIFGEIKEHSATMITINYLGYTRTIMNVNIQKYQYEFIRNSEISKCFDKRYNSTSSLYNEAKKLSLKFVNEL